MLLPPGVRAAAILTVAGQVLWVTRVPGGGKSAHWVPVPWRGHPVTGALPLPTGILLARVTHKGERSVPSRCHAGVSGYCQVMTDWTLRVAAKRLSLSAPL